MNRSINRSGKRRGKRTGESGSDRGDDGTENPKGRGVGLMRYASGLIRFIRRHGIDWGRIKCVIKLPNSYGKSTEKWYKSDMCILVLTSLV
jgi:hypothetical protein